MTEHPRITYQCSGRTFERLFKEQSLDETKNVVRKKLGLGHDSAIELAQLRDGKRIDLEDDGDFEAFMALTKKSLHATVAVIIPMKGRSSLDRVGKNSSGEWRGNHTGHEAAQSPSVQQPRTHSPRPRKKRKVTFNGDPVTSAPPQPCQQLASEDVRFSSPSEGPPSTLHPAPQAENNEPQPAADAAKTSRKKRKKRDSVALGKEPSPEPGASNPGDVIMSPYTRKKRHKSQPAGGAERSRDLAAPATADTSLRAGIEDTDLDMAKQTKTRKQKSRPVDAGSSITKSKLGPVDLTEDNTPDLTKTLKRKASRKKVEPAESKAVLDDDIDRTIAAFILKRLQPDSSSFPDPATAGELALPVDDPPLKTKRKGDKVKLGAGKNGVIPSVTQRTPNRVESLETSGADASIFGEVNGRSAPELNVAGTVIHPSAACPVVQRPDSNEPRITQMEKSPGLAPSSEVITSIHRFAEKTRPVTSDPRSDSSDMEPSLSAPSVALYRGSSTGAKPKIPKGHEISEVRVEAHGEGSSSESSTEGANDGDNPAQQRTPVNASSIRLHMEDQLVPLLHGSAKRSPRRSVLDEIPSSSETESKSNSEDLVLDEEEDLSLQPSRKQRRNHLITRLSSIEPELTSDDEEHLSVPVYMDTSHDVPPVPSIGVTGDQESIDAEVEVSDRPEVDTYPHEAGNQDHSISTQTGPRKFDATTPQSQSSTKIFGSASPKLDTTAINVEAAKPHELASTEQLTGRVLVPSSSPVIDGTTGNTETEALSQGANDDVESAVEPGGDEESDPIEPEPTQPLADRPSRSTDSLQRGHQRRASSTALTTPPLFDQPSRRSNRIANRQSSSGATLFPLTQVRRRITSVLEKPVQSAKEENGVIRNDAEEAPREKGVRNQVRKPGMKPLRSTARQPDYSGDDTSPSVAREDGSPISHVRRTSLPPSEQTKSNAPSVIDGSRSSNQGPLEKLSQSTSRAEKKMPLLTGHVLVPPRRKKGNIPPLFIPGSSQVPRHPSPSSSGSENESEEMTASLPMKTPTKSMPPNGSQFRRLTDLTSNGVLFSQPKPKSALRFKDTPSVKEQLRFDASDDGEDDDESSSSSDDIVPSSHIPRERHVGASRGRKGRGLSSLGDK